MTAETFDSYTAAMAHVQANLPHIDKGSINPAFKSKYADLADVSKAVLAVTSAAGLAWTVRTEFDAEGRYVLVGKMRHVSGEFEESVWPIPAGNPQQVGSALTYGRRYLLTAITGAVADDDDDGNAASQAKPATSSRPTARPGRVPAAQRNDDHAQLVRDVQSNPQTAERGPIPAEADPWASTPARKPPDPTAAADITAAVAGCDDLPTLRAIRKDVTAKAADGTLTEADAGELLTLIDEAGADLRQKYEAEQAKAAFK